MAPVILSYSYSGNNRLLAETLATALDCPMVEVTEPRRRGVLRIVLDLALRRFPKIAPVALPPGRDHVLVVTPVWNKWIAHPMRSALKALGPGIGAYSIVTFSGGAREGQVAFIDRQLTALAGHAPVNHWAMYVEKLVPPEIRGTPKVSDYGVSADELATYEEAAEIIDWFLPVARTGT